MTWYHIRDRFVVENHLACAIGREAVAMHRKLMKVVWKSLFTVSKAVVLPKTCLKLQTGSYTRCPPQIFVIQDSDSSCTRLRVLLDSNLDSNVRDPDLHSRTRTWRLRNWIQWKLWEAPSRAVWWWHIHYKQTCLCNSIRSTKQALVNLTHLDRLTRERVRTVFLIYAIGRSYCSEIAKAATACLHFWCHNYIDHG